jgi:tetratricopeptide (TPR) repeat protein
MAEIRKLTAIMAVDVVGYSRLMGEDEAGTARAVEEHRNAARPIVAALGGRIVKTMGDGLLLAFPSVVAAVYWAKSDYLSLSRRADEALRTADTGLAINPNYAALYGVRSNAKSSLGRFEQAKFDAQQAMRLSPRDPLIGLFHVQLGDSELGLGHFDAAIDEYRNATDSGYRPFFAYSNLAAAYALEGKMDEAKAALAEARRLNPKITVKWMIAHTPNLPPVFDGLRKAGLPEE